MNTRHYHSYSDIWIQQDDNFGCIRGVLVSVMHQLTPGRWSLKAAFHLKPQ